MDVCGRTDRHTKRNVVSSTAWPVYFDDMRRDNRTKDRCYVFVFITQTAGRPVMLDLVLVICTGESIHTWSAC